jgi:hypothetical protein
MCSAVDVKFTEMGIVKTLGQEEFTSVLCIMLCEVMSDAWK